MVCYFLASKSQSSSFSSCSERVKLKTGRVRNVSCLSLSLKRTPSLALPVHAKFEGFAEFWSTSSHSHYRSLLWLHVPAEAIGLGRIFCTFPQAPKEKPGVSNSRLDPAPELMWFYDEALRIVTVRDCLSDVILRARISGLESRRSGSSGNITVCSESTAQLPLGTAELRWEYLFRYRHSQTQRKF